MDSEFKLKLQVYNQLEVQFTLWAHDATGTGTVTEPLTALALAWTHWQGLTGRPSGIGSLEPPPSLHWHRASVSVPFTVAADR